ncbi:hypothetical protein MPNT_150034 [Candidatus Methylacidithermus pantelleriae]|uniref:Uncharacterized protein n=1 Tax=Candidatus Methylacidithermus pantelleriae TaxID=2744239 RepID=A0A8J2BII5_9BACT|nr:hypothetical protein MPNT_150034 [Candidatus Methylacidithermus pantelleriae]
MQSSQKETHGTQGKGINHRLLGLGNVLGVVLKGRMGVGDFVDQFREWERCVRMRKTAPSRTA